MRLTYAVAAVTLALITTTSAQNSQPTDQQVYERYRAWVTRQSSAPTATTARTTSDDDLLGAYREQLRSEGLPPAEVDRQLRVITESGSRLEIERWNQVLTNPTPGFNTQPNEFLARMIKGRKPGAALDVGMGQGRNTIFLAQQGWTASGFDPAERAVAAAQEQAQKLGACITTQAVDDEHFDWGKSKWDLILMSYVGVRQMVPRVLKSLKPGGLVVVEAYHRDATKTSSIGGGVVFDSNELLRLFDGLRVIHYEDTDAQSDFGARGRVSRVVRLAAEKPR